MRVADRLSYRQLVLLAFWEVVQGGRDDLTELIVK